MENKEPPKPRRPLPIPNVTPQRPNTPVMGSSPVASTSFYGTQKPPPLPTRPKNVGSSHTAYVAPPTSPPSYGSDNQPFREPELIPEDIAIDDERIPELFPQDMSQDWAHDVDPTPYQWRTTGPSWGQTWDGRNNQDTSWAGGRGSGFDSMDYLSSSYTSKTVEIDGRNNDEEANWWDPAVRERKNRPGPGILPPLLAEELHNPDHTLFSVSVKPPDIKMPEPPPTPEPQASAPSNSPTAPAASTSHHPPPTLPPPPPTENDVRTAVPHPNAYYCPKENGWVLLIWKSSSVSPPLARSFQNSQHPPLPDQSRRKRTGSCIGEGEQPFGLSNKTHHFHKYEKAVDALKLTPPFRHLEWENMDKVKQKRRAGTIILQDIDLEKLKGREEDIMDQDPEEEGKLLDLYMCCQCSFYCVVSGVIPGVIPRKFFEEFIREKRSNPTVGRSGEHAVVIALDTIIMVLENKLWKGESRMLRVTRPGFQTKMGWSPTVKRIFEFLGFVEEILTPNDEVALRPPVTDPISPQGKQNRAKLLRAWVEIGAWIVDFQRINASHFKEYKGHALSVKIDSAREMYQTAIGAHPDQIPRGLLGDSLMQALRPLQAAWRSLGLTPTTYSPDLLAFGYLAQCRCDPASTINHFTHLFNLVKIMQDLGNCPQDLQDLVVTERSRDRYTSDDLINATGVLGFGFDGPLKVEFESDIPEEFIENAWRECVRRSWRDPNGGKDLQREATEAFRILAEAVGSSKLRRIWEASKDKLMNPDRAYDTVEVPKDVDDSMLITVFSMRLEEQPLQIDKMREALAVIAEIRDSERLRQFLATGQDPGDIIAPTRPDLPRGLNQLGNTCYLNSLLQYFYTIRELRDSVVQMGQLYSKSLEDEKLTDDELKRHRVGGRLVTRREILRSKKFIKQLAELFFHMEYCEAAAVTPTIELAKLALVTSRDEEEDEADKGGTDSSNDTDATLVEDGPSRFVSEPTPESPRSPARSPGSVLGKRPRDIDRQQSEMDVDSPAADSPDDQDSFVTVPSPPPSTSPQPTREGSSSSKVEPLASTPGPDKDGDVEMNGSLPAKKPPPLPPRKPAESSDSVMMFGKQHDVAECMDNCMFQIETAMLKFDGLTGPQGDDKTSVVKRLFYGKIRQRLAVASDSRSSIHEKEDLFSHLPVNVADDGVDIYDGLSGYFDDVVEFEGKKARMEVSLVDLPPLLQIQLQRVQFNRETLQPYKSQAYVKFGETIYMDRFLESADPQKKVHSKSIQTELNACRERVRLLVQGKDGPFTTALQNACDFLSKQDDPIFSSVDDDLVFQLNQEQELVKEEIDELRTRVDKLKDELEAIWRDDSEVAYELTSVFIHRGSSPSWGHYFFYSRHLPDAPDSWFKYNDSDVSVVSKDEVLADTTGSTANPYLLVFARKGSEVVDTVKRCDTANLEELPS